MRAFQLGIVSVLATGLSAAAAIAQSEFSAEYTYTARDMPRTETGAEAPDWQVSNFAYPPEDVALEKQEDGATALRIGHPTANKQGRYTITLRYPWSTGKGFKHEVSMRFAADYGRHAYPSAGFGVFGPGGSIHINIADGKCSLGQVWMNRPTVPVLTDDVQAALDGQWDAKKLHTYTVKWKTTGNAGDVKFDVFVDGKKIKTVTGDSVPLNRSPGMFISIEYGSGTTLIESVQWKATPSEPVIQQLRQEKNTHVLTARGPGFGRMRINDVLKLLPADRQMILDFQWSQNQGYKLSAYPGEYLMPLYGRFFVASVPYQAIGPRLATMMDKRISEGAVLIVLGGPYAFGKGGYGDTDFEALLPARSVGPFEVKQFDKPQVMQPTDAARQLLPVNWDTKPTVSFYHQLKLTEDAEVLVSAGDAPMLIRRKHGRGYCYVFAGFSAGTEPNGYWHWSDWPKLWAGLLQQPAAPAAEH